MLKKEKKTTLYEIVNGIKPKKPTGAFRYFYSSIKEAGKLKGEKYPLGAASEMYAKLSDKDRQPFERLHKEDDLLYKLHLNEYKKQMTTRKGQAPSAINLYFADHKGQHETDGLKAGEILVILSNQWKNESDMVKGKYEERSAHLKGEMDAFNKRTLEQKRPSKGLSAYNFYIRENYTGMANKHKDLLTKEIFSKMAEKWAKCSDKEKAHYNKLASQDKERYEAEIKDYQVETSRRGRSDRTDAFHQGARNKSKATGYARYVESQIPEEEKKAAAAAKSQAKSRKKAASKRRTKSQQKARRVAKKEASSDNKSEKSKKSKTSEKSKSKAKTDKKVGSKSKGRSGQVKSRKEESVEKKAPKSTRSKSKAKTGKK